MGLSHIIEARQRKDGLDDASVVRLLDDIVQTIASGSEFAHNGSASFMRVGVEYGDTIVWLTKKKGSNAWIVTAYEKYPDGASAGRATHTPTSSTASLTRDGRVAGIGNIFQVGDIDVKRSANGSIQGFFDPISMADTTMTSLCNRAKLLLKTHKKTPSSSA